MKTIDFMIIAVLFGITPNGAAALESQFLRKPGQYSLDDRGSTLTITKQPAGSWTLEVTWRSGDASSFAAPEDCLRSEGWFVLVEQPGRIGIFDGVDGSVLLANSEKETTVSSYSHGVMPACPPKFWDALPPAVRAKYRKVEPDRAANGSQPIPSETHSTSAAAGSRR